MTMLRTAVRKMLSRNRDISMGRDIGPKSHAMSRPANATRAGIPIAPCGRWGARLAASGISKFRDPGPQFRGVQNPINVIGSGISRPHCQIKGRIWMYRIREIARFRDCAAVYYGGRIPETSRTLKYPEPLVSAHGPICGSSSLGISRFRRTISREVESHRRRVCG